MVFSEPAFLFYFLPWLLFIYFLVPWPLKNLILLAASLLFYMWGEQAYVWVMLLSIGMNYVFGLAVASGSESQLSRVMLWTGVGANLLLLGAMKYANFLADNIDVLLGALSLPQIHLARVHLPIGISFFTFQALSYVIDVYRGLVLPQRSLLRLALYKSLFPQLIAGPIVRYVDVVQQINKRIVTSEDFAWGVQRFIIGLGKKMILANRVAGPADAIFAMSVEQLTPALAWTGVICYGLQIYLDFSAYSDMAIGLGRMLGFSFLENFNYPYIARSVTEFWRRWHISLSTWFRDYLYIPLGGSRISPARTYVNLIIVFFLCGLWHGASWNFVIWGLLHGAFLILERANPLKAFHIRLAPLQHAYVLLAVTVGWVFFRAETLQSSIAFLAAMLGFAKGDGLAQNAGKFMTCEVITVILAGIIGSMPVMPMLSVWTTRRRREKHWVTLISSGRLAGLALILTYSIMLMASGSYSPFIYFRF